MVVHGHTLRANSQLLCLPDRVFFWGSSPARLCVFLAGESDCCIVYRVAKCIALELAVYVELHIILILLSYHCEPGGTIAPVVAEVRLFESRLRFFVSLFPSQKAQEREKRKSTLRRRVARY